MIVWQAINWGVVAMSRGLQAILLVGGTMIAATGAFAQTNPVKAGVEAWSNGDYKTAVADWRGPAASGDADAEFNMGQAYKLGRGVSADPARALDWYRKAALQGHFQAEDNYGLLLFQGGRLAEAVPWLEKSAMRGEPRAELVLGTMLFNGDGGQAKDWPRAYALMTRASDAGLPQATQTLADMDKYIPEGQRKQGLALAQKYEAAARRPQLPPEVTSPSVPAIRTTPMPPSQVDSSGPGASYPRPGTTPATPHHAETPAAKPVPAKPASHGGWRVQLGAFSTEARARALWESLSPKVPTLRGGQPYLVHAGSVTRLQAGAFSSAGEAERACVEVKRAGNPCLTVAP